MTDYYAHPTADVSPEARIGADTKIWQLCQVREHAVIGRRCILGRCVYIDAHVRIGDRVKIQNGVSVYEGVTIEEGVLCGPHCVFTNDLTPRAVNPDGTLKAAEDWVITPTLVRQGAGIGANAVIVCGVTIGRWAMVGAGAVVTRDVPDHGLVYGNPARLRAFVCPCGAKLERRREAAAPGTLPADETRVAMRCARCGSELDIPMTHYQLLVPDST